MRLSSESIQSQLQTKWLGRELLVIDECTSTNDEASRIAERGARHGYTVLAEKQTHGRGRQAREWISPEGGIWMTTVLRPTSHFPHLDGLPLLGALATPVVLSSKQTVKALVRWPNDVMFQDRKLAGTMVEAKFSGNRVTIQLSSGRLEGVFDGYENLTRVRIRPGEADVKLVDTSSVISVAYPAASDRP